MTQPASKNNQTKSHKETLGFQTEVKELLKLMINAVYSHKEIFLRELISNASDACDKLRFEAISNDKLYEGDTQLKINLRFDKAARTITVSDNGIGMNREEVVHNIGTIARSGTREFLQGLTGDKKQNAQMIGQFGVGFYSSFIVADKVTLRTRRAGGDKTAGVLWESTGEGEFTVSDIEKETRGTEVTLHLRAGQDEFLEQARLEQIIKKFSDHISLPIVLTVKDDKGKETDKTVNTGSALWLRPRTEITAKEYNEFYKTVSHDFADPLAFLHTKLEGKLEYTLLLFIPQHAPFDLWTREHRVGVKLYVKRVFIMDDAEKLLPNYLRFIRGVVDSNDLPLNISRELLQENQIIHTIRNTAVKKILDLLEDMAKNDKEKYQKFWGQFGRVLKEGVVEDFVNKDRIATLCRFSSTFDDKAEPLVSLDDYIFRMKSGQNKIYYLIADTFEAAKNSPLLEIFRKKGIEVLLLSDRVDHWFVSHLNKYKDKEFQSVSRGEIDLDEETEDKEEAAAKKEDKKKISDKHKELVGRIKKVLSDFVQDVRVSSRLTQSPACLVASEKDLDPNLKRLMEQLGQTVSTEKPILEINPEHAILKKMAAQTDDSIFKDWALVLYDQSLLTDGAPLKDPAGFVKRLNNLMLKLG